LKGWIVDRVIAGPAEEKAPQGLDLKRSEVRALRLGLTGHLYVKITGPGVNVRRFFAKSEQGGGKDNSQHERKIVEGLEAKGLIEERDGAMWTTDLGRKALEQDEVGIAERRGASQTSVGDGPKPRLKIGEVGRRG
jgi:hypothetical protein